MAKAAWNGVRPTSLSRHAAEKCRNRLWRGQRLKLRPELIRALEKTGRDRPAGAASCSWAAACVREVGDEADKRALGRGADGARQSRSTLHTQSLHAPAALQLHGGGARFDVVVDAAKRRLPRPRLVEPRFTADQRVRKLVSSRHRLGSARPSDVLLPVRRAHGHWRQHATWIRSCPPQLRQSLLVCP